MKKSVLVLLWTVLSSPHTDNGRLGRHRSRRNHQTKTQNKSKREPAAERKSVDSPTDDDRRHKTHASRPTVRDHHLGGCGKKSCAGPREGDQGLGSSTVRTSTTGAADWRAASRLKDRTSWIRKPTAMGGVRDPHPPRPLEREREGERGWRGGDQQFSFTSFWYVVVGSAPASTGVSQDRGRVWRVAVGCGRVSQCGNIACNISVRL